MIVRLSFLGALALASLVTVSASAQYAHPRGQPIDGIACDALEGQRIHIHQHLAIYDHGKAVGVPYDVGRPRDVPCLYWLHTHTPDGIIHIEAPVNRSFTLGNFFDVWVQPLSRTEAASAELEPGEQMRVWVDGKPYAGDPRAIALGDHTDIVIEVGPPFATPRPFTAWNGAQ
ncbi:MAG TPA: hypothetical protein VLD17_05715 [Gemmatimonadaceae bacterium]|jgi:hypothetical protein|nr:hypothetical protein [Gemmatimonadaceae bacterium]